ncbi:biphenyl 2,3-dioxygenase [Burkholderia sp. Bp9140]|uniref:VOC family protein n=1 Tax=Burkholderia sp. Bp9140 TaxID=2184572 RepID=UPI000F56AFE6|nr:VOC family protein [Burkholderia sp. Bp9140]RQR51330.1 biphenyl 2,3-dioxygenase [Burkholderia sp. Bp9140]
MHEPDRPTRFAHVVYRTYQYEEMINWYLFVFDGELQHSTPVVTFIAWDDEHHRIAIANLGFGRGASSERTPRGKPGLDHVAYGYVSLRDLLAKYSALKVRGVLPYWCIHHGPTVSLYYSDPDGNQMEFQVDVYANADEANEFMRSPAFSDNPIGVEIDPEEILGRLNSGEPEASILTRTSHHPISPVKGSALG